MDKEGRSTLWATILYPDSMPDNIDDLLTGFYIPIAVSPLHDRDFKDDGSPDKPHYHVLFNFGTVKKSLSQMKEIVSVIHGVGCEPIGSNRGYARYLCHLDNPDKAQYDINLVRTFSGYDYFDTIASKGSDLVILKTIIKWCNTYNCFAYCDLIDYCLDNNMEWFGVVSKKGSIIKEYMKSKVWKISQARNETT